MKNKLFYIICFILSFFTSQSLNSNEIFNLNVTEIEITEEGNLFKGRNGGEAYTNDGISIKAKNFEYNKSLLYLKATDEVECLHSFGLEAPFHQSVDKKRERVRSQSKSRDYPPPPDLKSKKSFRLPISKKQIHLFRFKRNF